MLETLRAWLNGKKEYFSGVAIYAELGNNAQLLQLFKKGPTPFTTKRLGEELLSICKQLKEQNHGSANPGRDFKKVSNKITAAGTGQKTDVRPHNSTLYEACQREADQAYKQVMNARAVLFASINPNEDPNTEDNIKARAPKAIEIVEGFKNVSQLYEQANFVQIHGHLPGSDPADKENEYDALPNHLVKQALDNLRKNYNKMKKREVTPEREAMLLQHEKNIKKLEIKWASLK